MTIVPFDLYAEQATLAAMILSPEIRATLLPILQPEHFYRLQHGDIFQAILKLSSAEKPVELISLRDELEHSGNLGKVGGVKVLMELCDPGGGFASHNGEYYAGLVLAAAQKREIALSLQQWASEAKSSRADVSELIAKILGLVEEIQVSGPVSSEPLEAAVLEAEKRLEARAKGERRGIETGIFRLDRLLRGFEPSQLVVLAGRPGSGKTAFATQVAGQVSIEQNREVLMFTAEVPAHQIGLNIMRQRAGFDYSALAPGSFEATTFERWQRVRKEVAAALLNLDDGARSVEDVVGRTLRAAQKGALSLVIVDYLQLLRTSLKAKRNEQVAHCVQELKRLALKLDVVVLVLSQLGRPQEGVSYLAWSGEIEQAADIILRLGYKPGYDHPDVVPEGLIAERRLLVAKNRNGPVGEVMLQFNKPILHFSEDVKDERSTQTDAEEARGGRNAPGQANQSALGLVCRPGSGDADAEGTGSDPFDVPEGEIPF